MKSIAKFVMSLNSEENIYNGHYQTEISGMSLKKGIKLTKQLEKKFPEYSFVLELWNCGSFIIKQKDFWSDPKDSPYGEHRDRTILSVRGVK